MSGNYGKFLHGRAAVCKCGKPRHRDASVCFICFRESRASDPSDFIAQRIRIEDRGHATPCHIWPLWLNERGYAKATIPTFGTVRVHRAAYILKNGPIPGGLELDHLCNVRSCVNPDHLEPVTAMENSRRRIARAKEAAA